MITNYLSIAWRNLLKHRTFSTINIVGLAIGISAFWLILHYAFYELSYERFNSDAENI
jgi:putative ABC transport system permease protein